MAKVIQIADLTFRYPDGQLALDRVSLAVAECDSLGLIGPNGAGKSTLLMHLNGVLGVPDGKVQVCGMPVDKQHLGKVRNCVGLVFQLADDQLFMPTVFEDVAFGPLNQGLPPNQVRERVRQALRQVGLTGYEDRMAHHLSVGEKRRAAIATVLAMQVSVLAMDEPTSNLDPAARGELIGLLRNLNITKVIASHDLEMVGAVCNHVAVLSRGQVVAHGAAKEILTDQDLLAKHGLVSRW